MTKYTVFLRGINVGGHKKVQMAKLRDVLSSLGFSDVKTLLASGNIVLSSKKNKAEVQKLVGKCVLDNFGFEVSVLVRKFADIENIVLSDPFAGYELDAKMRFFVTFLSENKVFGKKKDMQLGDDFKIIKKGKTEVFSILYLGKVGSVDAMSYLENEYGKNITTRNWNTINKLVKL